MEDVSKLNLYGTNYNIKDSNARSAASTAQSIANEAKSAASTAQTKANEANTKADSNANNITKIISSSVDITFEESTETLKVTRGITI